MLHFILTVAVGAAAGYLFYRLKVPGGMLVGSIIGAAALNICFNAALVPAEMKILAQLTAGAFIGTSVERSDLRRLRHIWRPAVILLSSYMVVNLLIGLIIYLVSPLDLITSFFCAVPGGISDVPLIAADMGAQPAKVAVLQFVRMIVGTGVFPAMISLVCRNEPQQPESDGDMPSSGEPGKPKDFAATAVVALGSGILGSVSGIPAGTLVFPLFSVIALKLWHGKAYLPMWTKRMAQILSGAYIGCSIGLADLLELRYLALPAILLVTGYSAFCFLGGHMLKRFCGMTRKEAMLAATPAGASDMALISLDMGVKSADLALLQVFRLIVVIAVFPQIIGLVCRLAA